METKPRISEAVERLKVVFAEVPGTQLSLADASRLAGLERATCREVLEALTDARFLARGRNGMYVRRTSDSPMA
jgi:DNA-binding IclR family transcriptional regulator